MIRRLIAWRHTEAGIWADWFVSAAISTAAPIASIALGWHWISTTALTALAVLICGLLILMLSIRNKLGDTDGPRRMRAARIGPQVTCPARKDHPHD